MMRCVRTTINLDDDVLETTRAIARAERRALGAVVSDLVRRGLVPPQPRIDDEDGFPVFRVRQPPSRSLTRWSELPWLKPDVPARRQPAGEFGLAQPHTPPAGDGVVPTQG